MAILSAVVVALTITSAGTASAADISGTMGSDSFNCGSYTVSPRPHSVFMVGDSITHRGEYDLHTLRRHWDINARSSRNVDCLPQIIAERMKGSVKIGKLVIALGTNATEGWKKAAYQQVVDMLPATTPIIFVSTYRDPAKWPHTNAVRTRASVQYWYSRWMSAIARERSNICVVSWRWTAQHHPDLLVDGVHPRMGAGTELWARKVAARVGTCWTDPDGHKTDTRALTRHLARIQRQ